VEQSISSSQNQLTCQTKRIRSEELEPTAFHFRKRAIEARSVGILRSVQASSYNLGGWRSFFEEYVPQPFSTNAISQNPETSAHAIANSATSVETSTSADPRLSRSSNDSSRRESSPSVPDVAMMPLCPSGRLEAGEAVVFGVVGGTVAAPLVGYLTEPMPVNEDILALSGSVEPTEIFRIACCRSTASLSDSPTLPLVAARRKSRLPALSSSSDRQLLCVRAVTASSGSKQ
jgi:hypothetical protein